MPARVPWHDVALVWVAIARVLCRDASALRAVLQVNRTSRAALLQTRPGPAFEVGGEGATVARILRRLAGLGPARALCTVLVRRAIITAADRFDGLFGVAFHYCSHLKSVAAVEDVVSLSLYQCKGVGALPPCYAVRELYLSSTPVPTDFADLRGLQKLTLDCARCGRAVVDADLAALAGLQRLELIRAAITDPSPLARVPSLEFVECERLGDVSSLRRANFLTLRACPSISGVSALRSVGSLTLSRIPGAIRGLEGIGRLHLWECADAAPPARLGALEISDAHSLVAMPPVDAVFVTLRRCSLLTGLAAGPRLRSIHLSGLPELADLSPLAGVDEVTIARCEKVVDVRPLRAARFVSLSKCEVRDVSPLKDARRVVLVGLPTSSIAVLASVPHLRVEGCPRLFDVAGMRNDFLSISACEGIARHAAQLAGVGTLVLENLANILDVAALAGVADLAVVGCLNVAGASTLLSGARPPRLRFWSCRGIPRTTATTASMTFYDT